MPTELERFEIAVTLRARMKNALSGANILAEIDEVGYSWTPSPAITNGTAADQADRAMVIYNDAITSGNNLDLNMRDGTNWEGQATNNDLLGTLLANAEIVGLFIENLSTSVGNLVIGGEGTSEAWLGFLGANAHTITLKPGGVFFIFMPSDPAMAVGGATDDVLRLAASGGDVTFRASALARSA